MTIVSGLVLLSTSLPTYLPVCQPGQILLFFRDKNFFLPCQEQNGSIPLKALSCIYSTCTYNLYVQSFMRNCYGL